MWPWARGPAPAEIATARDPFEAGAGAGMGSGLCRLCPPGLPLLGAAGARQDVGSFVCGFPLRRGAGECFFGEGDSDESGIENSFFYFPFSKAGEDECEKQEKYPPPSAPTSQELPSAAPQAAKERGLQPRSSSPVELGLERPVAPVWWVAEGS